MLIQRADVAQIGLDKIRAKALRCAIRLIGELAVESAVPSGEPAVPFGSRRNSRRQKWEKVSTFRTIIRYIFANHSLN
jgi:hypothetical protein